MLESYAVTCKEGEIHDADTTYVGRNKNESWLEVTTKMLKAELVAPVSAPDDAASVYPVPTLLMLRFGKEATPLAAATVAVPESVPPPGFVPIATVMFDE